MLIENSLNNIIARQQLTVKYNLSLITVYFVATLTSDSIVLFCTHSGKEVSWW